MYLTEHFASFIAHTNYEDLPQDVIVQAKERIMDTVGAVSYTHLRAHETL